MNTASIRTISRARESRQLAVKRAEAFLSMHLDESVPMADLCRAIGVNERRLRKAFQEVRGTSPKRWAIRARLAVVRRALRHSDANNATVTAVATSYGFYELGRFAGTYKAAFGETPSETLRATSSGSLGVAS